MKGEKGTQILHVLLKYFLRNAGTHSYNLEDHFYLRHGEEEKTPRYAK